MLEKNRYITDLIKDFDLQKYVENRYKRNENKERVEGMYELDFFCFKEY